MSRSSAEAHLVTLSVVTVLIMQMHGACKPTVHHGTTIYCVVLAAQHCCAVCNMHSVHVGNSEES